MATCISHSPAETETLGETWGRAARSGLVIALSGDLGAGKTQLVKGLARGLNIPARVHSPSFALVNVYTGGRLTLFHLDLYRLDTRGQIASAGLEEYLRPAGVTVIEWAEKWFGNAQGLEHTSQPRPALRARSSMRWVTIETLNQTERRISYEDSGA
jgi:tRNA threonylcarbamoyladenosine biosynthesis protein TsaE